jgi:SAM-dependent methyltransferase
VILALDDKRPPVPPADLILRVSLGFDVEEIEAEREAFDLRGLDNLQLFENALGATGRSLADATRLLDFGCGCGRFLRHLRPLSESAELHGVDIDAEMIAWLNDNVPFVQGTVGQTAPPLPFPDGFFDVVINHSVFSHLDEHHQDLWLAELRRVTAPDGVLLLTVEGPSSWNRTAALGEAGGDDVERWRNELETKGILSITDDHFIGSTHPESYHSTIHAPWYVFEHWTAFFDVVSYIPDGSISQDIVVLLRRADDAPAPRPVGRRFSGEASQLSTIPSEPARSDGEALDPVALTRQLNMLRAATYEQGRRISVIAAQLRDEIAAAQTTPAPPPQVSLRASTEHVVRGVARRARAQLRQRG